MRSGGPQQAISIQPEYRLTMPGKDSNNEHSLERKLGGRARLRRGLMCDYSLEMYGSRPAREGELYVSTRFPSGSIGFAAPGARGVPVCLQCDTTVVLTDIPASMQKAYGIGSEVETVFAQRETGLLPRRSAPEGPPLPVAAGPAARHRRLCAEPARAQPAGARPRPRSGDCRLTTG